MILLTYKETAHYLNVSLSTVIRLIKSGDLTPIYVTQRNPRISNENIEKLLKIQS